MSNNLLEAYAYGAVLRERERIIKLLEERGNHEWHGDHNEITCDTCHNIALIRGEQN